MTIPWKEVATVASTVLISGAMEVVKRKEQEKVIRNISKQIGKEILTTLKVD